MSHKRNGQQARKHRQQKALVRRTRDVNLWKSGAHPTVDLYPRQTARGKEAIARRDVRHLKHTLGERDVPVPGDIEDHCLEQAAARGISIEDIVEVMENPQFSYSPPAHPGQVRLRIGDLTVVTENGRAVTTFYAEDPVEEAS